jgi:hypothetical protein
MQALIQQKHAGHQAVEQFGGLDVNGVVFEFSGQSERPVGGNRARSLSE